MAEQASCEISEDIARLFPLTNSGEHSIRVILLMVLVTLLFSLVAKVFVFEERAVEKTDADDAIDI